MQDIIFQPVMRGFDIHIVRPGGVLGLDDQESCLGIGTVGLPGKAGLETQAVVVSMTHSDGGALAAVMTLDEAFRIANELYARADAIRTAMLDAQRDAQGGRS